MAGFVEVHEAGGRVLFIDVGRVIGCSCPGMPETTASKGEPVELLISGEPPKNVIGISPLNLLARIAYTRVMAKESPNPLFVIFMDGVEWDVVVQRRSTNAPA